MKTLLACIVILLYAVESKGQLVLIISTENKDTSFKSWYTYIDTTSFHEYWLNNKFQYHFKTIFATKPIVGQKLVLQDINSIEWLVGIENFHKPYLDRFLERERLKKEQALAEQQAKEQKKEPSKRR